MRHGQGRRKFLLLEVKFGLRDRRSCAKEPKHFGRSSTGVYRFEHGRLNHTHITVRSKKAFGFVAVKTKKKEKEEKNIISRNHNCIMGQKVFKHTQKSKSYI